MSFLRLGSYGIKQLETFSPARIAGVRRHAAINTPVGEVDISWLEGAAAHYHITADPYDYVFSINRIVVADIPNRNSDAFMREELLSFHVTAAIPVWQTFRGKPLYFEHNQVPKDARGIIFKSFLTTEGPYLVVTNICGASKTKDRDLARAIENNTRPYFSMGCLADEVQCSYCGKIATETREFCDHLTNHMGRPIGSRLVYEKLRKVSYIEQSSVADPAALIAGKGNLELIDGKAVLPQQKKSPWS